MPRICAAFFAPHHLRIPDDSITDILVLLTGNQTAHDSLTPSPVLDGEFRQFEVECLSGFLIFRSFSKRLLIGLRKLFIQLECRLF
jgi:hypothetical protein